MGIKLAMIVFVLVAVNVTASRAGDVSYAIVFAVDASLSVDSQTADLQREGHVSALTSPEVLKAIRSAYPACIVVSYFEWSSRDLSWMILPWTKICNEDDAARSASIIRANGDQGKKRTGPAMTSVSSAINFAVSLLDDVHGKNMKKVIDISSNGVNNQGPPVSESRDHALSLGYTINAITIPSFEEGDIETYYIEHVIGGPGSFVMTPKSAQAYSVALRRKIVIELSTLESPFVLVSTD